MGAGVQERLCTLVLQRPAAILLVALLVSLISLASLVDFENLTLRVDVDASLTGLLPVRGAALDTYRRVRDSFGGDDVLLVAWFDDALFSADVLQRLKRFTRRVQRTEGVIRVDGLANAMNVRAVDGEIRVDRLLKRVPRDAAGIAALAADATANPLYSGQLLARDGRGALLAVHFAPELDSAALREAVHTIARASAEEAGGVEQLISGPVYARLELSHVLFRDIRLALPLAILVTAAIAAVTLRSVRGVGLPLFSTALGLAAALAMFVTAGNALNFVTAIIPSVVFVVGFAFAVHVITEFDRAYTTPANKREAIARTLDEIFAPLTLTAVTTVVGFASLATSSIASIRVFGIYTACGTALCWLTALVVIPAALMCFPTRVVSGFERSRLTRWAPALARFDTRRRRAVLASGALLVVIAGLFATRVEVSTDYLANFAADNPVRVSFARIHRDFGGAVPLQILIESDLPGAFLDPLHLATVGAFEAWLKRQPEIGAVTSLVDYIGVLNRAFNAGAEGDDQPAIPATPGEVEDLLFLSGGDELERFTDSRRERMLIHVRTSAVSTTHLAALMARIDAELAALPGHLHAEVTGSSALLARTLDDVVRGQLTSLAGALAIIYALLVVLFGTARAAALALLPNALPIVCFFGLLGATGTTLNLATSLVAAIVLGIAVDDTMHFLSRFNTEARRLANEAQGLESALTSVIRPVTFTTLALCCGFLTLTFGELRSQVEFGGLAAATLFIAWVCDLTFTPALAGQLRFVTLWEVLTLDLGAAPHKTIPFFAGLTNRQARIAAILGSMRSYARGENILHQGDEGRDIHVVIEGEVRAYVHRDDGDEVLRTLERGALIGEVALFRGHRTANVDAATNVRLLRFDQGCLERIEARYPRIAARLYHNLGEIIAERLEDLTKRL